MFDLVVTTRCVEENRYKTACECAGIGSDRVMAVRTGLVLTATKHGKFEYTNLDKTSIEQKAQFQYDPCIRVLVPFYLLSCGLTVFAQPSLDAVCLSLCRVDASSSFAFSSSCSLPLS